MMTTKRMESQEEKRDRERWLVMTLTEATDVICCSNDMKMMMTKLFPPANVYVHSRKEKRDRTVSVFRQERPSPIFIILLSFFFKLFLLYFST